MLLGAEGEGAGWAGTGTSPLALRGSPNSWRHPALEMNHEAVQVSDTGRRQDCLATHRTDWIAALVELIVQLPRLVITAATDWRSSDDPVPGLLDQGTAPDTQSRGGWGQLVRSDPVHGPPRDGGMLDTPNTRRQEPAKDISVDTGGPGGYLGTGRPLSDPTPGPSLGRDGFAGGRFAGGARAKRGELFGWGAHSCRITVASPETPDHSAVPPSARCRSP